MSEKEARYPNRLKDAIKCAGLTLKEVSEETGIPLRTLSDYSAGKVPIPHRKLEAIALVIGCSSQYLVSAAPQTGLVLFQSSAGQADHWLALGVLSSLDKLRRDILLQTKKLASVASMSPLIPIEELLNPDAWERLLAVLEKSTQADEAMLMHLEVLTDAYWDLYRTAIAKIDLLSSVSGHLTTVARLLKTTQPLSAQFRLCSIASNSAQILGEIYYDLGMIEAAKAYYNLAARTAEEVGNRALQATALGREGFLPVYWGKPHEALPLLDGASTLAEGHITGKTKAWIGMMEAEALSMVEGQEKACILVLNKVDDAFHQDETQREETPNRDDRKWTGFNQPTLIGYKGTCLLNLHRDVEARTLLARALEELPPGPTRRRSLLLADLARSYVQSHEIEEACNVATQALILTAQSKSPRALQHLRSFQKTLRPWRDLVCVRHFSSAMKMVETV